jgi:hypothetical protein
MDGEYAGVKVALKQAMRAGPGRYAGTVVIFLEVRR